jgi:hypothetical protein
MKDWWNERQNLHNSNIVMHFRMAIFFLLMVLLYSYFTVGLLTELPERCQKISMEPT